MPAAAVIPAPIAYIKVGGSESATRLREVGIASNRGSERHGEYVPGSCILESIF